MQAEELREIEWAPSKEATLLFPVSESAPEEYGPWQLAGDVGRARGQIPGEAFVLQEDGKLRCPAGASLWLSEVRQENAFTQRAVYLAYQTDCQPCALREQCLAPGAKGNRARRVSVVRRLLPPVLATWVIRSQNPVFSNELVPQTNTIMRRKVPPSLHSLKGSQSHFMGTDLFCPYYPIKGSGRKFGNVINSN